MNVKVYRYHIETPSGERLEENIPEEDQANTILNFLQEQLHRSDLVITKEHMPQAKGLGRDPDLH